MSTSTEIEVHGTVAPGFEEVRDAFAAFVAEGQPTREPSSAPM